MSEIRAQIECRHIKYKLNANRAHIKSMLSANRMKVERKLRSHFNKFYVPRVAISLSHLVGFLYKEVKKVPQNHTSSNQ